MPPGLKIPLKFDTSDLENTTRQLLAIRGKGSFPEEIAKGLNKKMGWLHRRWLWNVKKADFERIKMELGAELQSVAGKRVAVLKRKKLGLKDKYYNQLATLIIVARYRRAGKPIPSAGKLKSEALKLVRSKIRSVAFLKSTIATAMKPFLPYCSGAGGGGPPKSDDERQRPVGRPKGWGTLAKPDGKRMLAVSVTRAYTKKKGFAGMEKYMVPGLEKAYADELKDTKKFLDGVLYQTAKNLGVTCKK